MRLLIASSRIATSSVKSQLLVNFITILSYSGMATSGSGLLRNSLPLVMAILPVFLSLQARKPKKQLAEHSSKLSQSKRTLCQVNDIGFLICLEVKVFLNPRMFCIIWKNPDNLTTERRVFGDSFCCC